MENSKISFTSAFRKVGKPWTMVLTGIIWVYTLLIFIPTMLGGAETTDIDGGLESKVFVVLQMLFLMPIIAFFQGLFISFLYWFYFDTFRRSDRKK